uniref:hypothetical protein n=1 Tax=Enterococcus faecalis TaxID=1351 RepID=UPI00041BC3D7|nr:hypothetical protein [Enterococcus faecalis]
MTESKDKLFGFKKKPMLIGLFSIALLGSGIAYSAVSYNEPKEKATIEKKVKVKKESNEPTWESKVPKPKKQKQDAKSKDPLTEYIETKEDPINPMVDNQEVGPTRENLLAQLNNALAVQEKKEAKSAEEQAPVESTPIKESQPIFTPLVSTPVNRGQQTIDEKIAPTETGHKEEPVTKPNVEPTPVPDQKPIPTPEPNPEPNPEPTPPPVVETDFTALSILVEQANGLDLQLYLSSSIEPLKLELSAAQQMLDAKNHSQEAVNLQTTHLQTAMDTLVLKGDKSVLTSTYQQSMLLEKDLYTEETVAVLNDSQAIAKACLDNEEVTQAQVDEANNQLQSAVSQLKEKEEPDLSLAYLQRVLDSAMGIDVTQYTETTGTVLLNKRSEVQSYIASNAITKEANERYTLELHQAIDQLQSKVDSSKVLALISTTQQLDRTKYTDDSLQQLDATVAAVTSQLENETITQEQVDVLYEELQQRLNQLVEKQELPAETEASSNDL